MLHCHDVKTDCLDNLTIFSMEIKACYDFNFYNMWFLPYEPINLRSVKYIVYESLKATSSSSWP